MRRRVVLVAAVFLVAAVGVRNSSGQDVEVSRQGKHRIWYTSPNLRAELNYHWADSHLGDEWLVVKVALGAGSGGVTPLAREAIRVRAPSGDTVSLLSQDEFRQALGKVWMALERENVWGPAESRFGGSLNRSEEWFFSPPGAYFHREIIHPSPFQYCAGPLVFLVPGGVQPGGWTLIIDLQESSARIPFVLGESQR